MDRIEIFCFFIKLIIILGSSKLLFQMLWEVVESNLGNYEIGEQTNELGECELSNEQTRQITNLSNERTRRTNKPVEPNLT